MNQEVETPEDEVAQSAAESAQPEAEAAVPEQESEANESVAENASSVDEAAVSVSEPPVAVSSESLPSFFPEFKNDILNDCVRRCLEPIEGTNSCGESDDAASSVISQIETTGDGIHESLRIAFGDSVRDDSPTSFDMATVGREAGTLVEQIVDCLAEKSKSLLLSAYLPHLMLIVYGPDGFDAGLTVIRELITRFGDQLYPRDNEKLSSFLRRGVYIGNDDKVTDNYKLFLYLPITENETLPYALLRNAKLKGVGGDVEGRYAADASRSSVDFYVDLIEGLARSCERAKEVNSVLGSLLGDNTYEIVSFQFIESVARMCSIVGSLATSNCSGYPPIEEEEVEDAGAGEQAAAAPVQLAAGEIVNREQAIKMLVKIADFFYKTEKHSPISYRIRDTVKWCEMDFPELLQMLLDGDVNRMSEMQKRVGFGEPTSEYEQE